MKRPRRRITLNPRSAFRVTAFLVVVWLFGFMTGWLEAMVEDPSFFATTLVMSAVGVAAASLT